MLLAALLHLRRFGNDSQRETRLVGSLKHKVVSLLRRKMLLGALSDAQDNDEGNVLERLLFKAMATLNEVPAIADVNDGSDHPRSSVLRAMQGEVAPAPLDTRASLSNTPGLRTYRP